LTLTTKTGAEVVIQSILRAEPEYLVIRGRMAGTTDGGNFFVVPFGHINFMTFQRTIKEDEVRALFERPDAARAQATAPAAQAAAAAAAVQSSSAEARGGLDKLSLLERLRSRRPVTEPIRVNGGNADSPQSPNP
jgi:hypothetical protein